MPKIRDLGINVIPETMRPPEIGPGGGGGGECPATSPVTTTAYAQTCLTTFPGQTGQYAQAQGGWTCLTTSPGHTGYYQQYVGGTCLTTSPTHAYAQQYVGGTCLTTSPTHRPDVAYTCLTTSPGHGSGQPDCAVLTRDAIQQLKAQLQKQIEQLDEYARNLGPKTVEAIEAREKELKAELEELAQRRKEYKQKE